MTDTERKAKNAEKARLWRAKNPDKVRAIKQRYYSSDKGKAQKRKEDARFIASGGRKRVELKRSSSPVSDARKAARKKWAENNQHYFTAMRAYRRALNSKLNAFEFWVLQEAVLLARLREKLLGFAWHVDHIVPVSKGGDSRPDNLQVVPAAWNIRKSNVHTERFFGAKE